MMVIREITDVLRSMCDAYQNQDYDFTKWFSMPLLVIEDDGNYTVSDPEVVAQLFKGVNHCYAQLELPTINFHLQHLQVVSDRLAVITLVWDFLNSHQKVEITLEVGYILQKKEDGLKIISLLQPLWREPTRRRDDIKECVTSGKK